MCLSEQDIEWFVRSVVRGEMKDYQISALLMAIFLNGMSEEETSCLTRAMRDSGDKLPSLGPCAVDKHSTGGVGDKTTFIVAPVAAACGVTVPMIAGRGLGHTGGTIDKMESMAGIQTYFGLEEFSRLLEKSGFFIVGQTNEIAPVDKKLYALRDVTATINSIPLITASIMSKKLAEGISGLVADVKYGSGAFIQDSQQAKALAHSLIKTGKANGAKVMAFVSSMESPLGQAVGHSLEIIECIETLKGGGPEDLKELSLQLSAGMIYLAAKASSREQAKEMAMEALSTGAALDKFTSFIEAQGGDCSVVDDPQRLPVAKQRHEVRAPRGGYIESFKTDEIGLMMVELGGGRKYKEDSIDFSVGLKFYKKVGDAIEEGETILTFYHHQSQKALVQSLEQLFLEKIMAVSPQRPQVPPLILETLF